MQNHGSTTGTLLSTAANLAHLFTLQPPHSRQTSSLFDRCTPDRPLPLRQQHTSQILPLDRRTHHAAVLFNRRAHHADLFDSSTPGGSRLRQARTPGRHLPLQQQHTRHTSSPSTNAHQAVIFPFNSSTPGRPLPFDRHNQADLFPFDRCKPGGPLPLRQAQARLTYSPSTSTNQADLFLFDRLKPGRPLPLR